MNMTINLEKLTDGKLKGEIRVSAFEWETRYSWGHTAEVTVDYKVVAREKIRYYNRTWESYRFQSAIHSALNGYIRHITGFDPDRDLSKRDTNPMKGKEAENRRLERVAAYEFACSLYEALKAKVDGKAVIPQVIGSPRKVA